MAYHHHGLELARIGVHHGGTVEPIECYSSRTWPKMLAAMKYDGTDEDLITEILETQEV